MHLTLRNIPLILLLSAPVAFSEVDFIRDPIGITEKSFRENRSGDRVSECSNYHCVKLRQKALVPLTIEKDQLLGCPVTSHYVFADDKLITVIIEHGAECAPSFKAMLIQSYGNPIVRGQDAYWYGHDKNGEGYLAIGWTELSQDKQLYSLNFYSSTFDQYSEKF